MDDKSEKGAITSDNRIGHLEKARRVNFWDLDKDFQSGIASGEWITDSDEEPCNFFNFETWQNDGFKRTDLINLNELPPESVIYFFCSNPHAFYTLKILEGNKVKVWRDNSGGTTGLVTTIDNIGILDQKSIDQQTNEINYYEGVLVARENTHKQPRITMPIFLYEGNKVKPPTADAWTDIITYMFIKRPREMPESD